MTHNPEQSLEVSDDLSFSWNGPWLERPGLWADVHAPLIVSLASDLNPRLRPRYRAAIEQSEYEITVLPDELIGKPDVAIHTAPVFAGPLQFSGVALAVAEPIEVETPHAERVTQRWLEIRTVPSGEVVTVIEILSPVNKQPGEGRLLYERKRNRILGSRAHLVEVDFLRAGRRMEMRGVERKPIGGYRILVSHAAGRPRADLYPFGVREAIPRFPLPLREDDAKPVVDLGAILHGLYDRASYDLAIDYNADPDPPLEMDDRGWAKALVTQNQPPAG